MMRISWVAYATEESASLAKIGSARRLGSSDSPTRSLRTGRPRTSRFGSCPRSDRDGTARSYGRRRPSRRLRVVCHATEEQARPVAARGPRPGCSFAGRECAEIRAARRGSGDTRARGRDGLRARRLRHRPPPRGGRPQRRVDRQGPRGLPPAGSRLRRPPGHRPRLRPADAARRRDRLGRGVRRVQQRRQLEHHQRPRRTRDVRRPARRRPHLRREAGRGLRAHGHPERGDRPVDGEPAAARAAVGQGQRGVARADRSGAAHAGDRHRDVGGPQARRAGEGLRGARGVAGPLRRGPAAHAEHGAAGRRPPGGGRDRRDRLARARHRRTGRRGRARLMRVTIAGAGAVGRSIAGELLANGHSVMLIEKDGRKVRTRAVPGAEWVQADACEVTSLEEAQLATSDVAIAATGDDKANLVFALLAKTEFAVNRVVARVKEPRNEWLYTEAWGVDVAVSTPRVLAALVEEAVTVGDVVRLMSFRKGAANLVEITLAEDTPWVGKPLREVPLPRETVLTAILRGERVITPSPDEPLEAGDELLFVAHAEVEEQLQAVLAPGTAGAL